MSTSEPALEPDRVLVAGVGGASLGTEIGKSLALAGGYQISGCDISPYAFGLHDRLFGKTRLIDRQAYADNVLDLALEWGVRSVIPGGEEPLRLLLEAQTAFEREGVALAVNASEVIRQCSDKQRLFADLEHLGFPVPWTVPISDSDTLRASAIPGYPCVVKPSTRSGGSAHVFLVQSFAELNVYVRLIASVSGPAVVQEYISPEEGEFTIGVLSLPGASLVRSMALRRLFNAKLSVATSSAWGVVSSGYSQGLIDDFPEVREQAEHLASGLKNSGPMNIQARVRDGLLLPFEINPRFSASTYLRAMAGFNDVDVFLKYTLHGTIVKANEIRSGYYLRTLGETFVSKADLQ
jgi:carbamoyl-phosphate synthase large subunit